MSRKLAVDLPYFPNLEYFAALAEADEILLCSGDLYQRQSYFNRTKIRLANKIETLSVPIQGRRPRIPLSQIKIDNQQKWLNTHLRGIQSAYGKAPFYEFYFPYFEQVFLGEQESLWDLNLEVLTICLKLLGFPVKMSVVHTLENKQGLIDIRGQMLPSKPFMHRDYYSPVPYFQLFGLDFEPNLSVLDLLFCEGPTAKSILLKSVKKH
ncbi:WbqC family protein [Algoriphagus halophytocola]|uniref:WbqC family protein n=1 Tax=Algoriphagus halophytocola TaxID=2991499 RepID=A0ABY6MEW1_9BACT|nr:WbqC family protein [Algoriphagus sp. TR-M5]UZD22326.1 WbqC family protein [Algoriphagus sp. TR-M5]